MITRISLEMDLPQELKTVNLGSVLHGALMDSLPEETAERLHQASAYSPLKQRLILDNSVTWEIVSLNLELGDELIDLVTNKKYFQLDRHQTQIAFKVLTIEKISVKELMTACLTNETLPSFIKLKICTPMSFKSKGMYEIFPDMKKFFRSIMLNFDSFYNEYQIFDQETLDFIDQSVQIVDYRLNSTRYHLEGIKIPSFKGQLTLKIRGPETFRQFMNFLLIFGEFSGVGIKTSLGMGKYQVLNLPNNKPLDSGKID